LLQVKPINNQEQMIKTENGLLYENVDCRISYQFWSDGGNAGFVFYNKTDKIIGDFLIGGNLSGNVEDRVLVLNIKYNKFTDVVQPLLEFFSQIESNEFDDVSEFTCEVEARLEAEEPERSSGEEPEEQEGENDNNLPVIS
jgi:hypothetical protein